MEEQKKTNEVKMEVNQGKQEAGVPKLTYEQLNDACIQLQQQRQNLLMQLRQADLSNMFTRLGFLFKVMELSDKFTGDFVVKCQEEIEAMLTISDEDAPEKKEG